MWFHDVATANVYFIQINSGKYLTPLSLTKGQNGNRADVQPFHFTSACSGVNTVWAASICYSLRQAQFSDIMAAPTLSTALTADTTRTQHGLKKQA